MAFHWCPSRVLLCGHLCHFASSLHGNFALVWKNTSLLLRFYAFWKFFPGKIRLCFFAFTLLEKFPPKKSGFATSLLCFLENFPKKIRLCFFASTLLEKISQKKAPLAPTLLRFHASLAPLGSPRFSLALYCSTNLEYTGFFLI